MIVIIDYGLGNLFSVAKAFESLGAPVTVSRDPTIVGAAERIVLPGVGAFGNGIRFLKERKLIPALHEAVLKRGVPFLGICLGMQLLAEHSTEYGEHQGFGWVFGAVIKLDITGAGLKIPHIGWNQVIFKKEHPLFLGIKQGADFYFVHSYELQPTDLEDLLAVSHYGKEMTAAVGRKNIVGVQFHPEKSQDNGLKLLRNFISWKP
ncbi:MAG TPA: imidazole glycerol phosphate synthase subunit HisH [Candidatus Paceibacterota bacterium]